MVVIWGNVICDFLALNKVEILPWDSGWGYLPNNLTDPLPDKMVLDIYDKIANLTTTPVQSYFYIRCMFANNP